VSAWIGALARRLARERPSNQHLVVLPRITTSPQIEYRIGESTEDLSPQWATPPASRATCQPVIS
jgi:hypothetical protein